MLFGQRGETFICQHRPTFSRIFPNNPGNREFRRIRAPGNFPARPPIILKQASSSTIRLLFRRGMLQGIRNLHTGLTRPPDSENDVGPRFRKFAGQPAKFGKDHAAPLGIQGGEQAGGAPGGIRRTEPESRSTGMFERYLDQILSQWKSSEATLDRADAQLPPELSIFLNMQRTMNRAGVEIQLISSVAEAVNQSIKRLQQAAGG